MAMMEFQSEEGCRRPRSSRSKKLSGAVDFWRAFPVRLPDGEIVNGSVTAVKKLVSRSRKPGGAVDFWGAFACLMERLSMAASPQ